MPGSHTTALASMLSGNWYTADDGQLVAMADRARRAQHEFNTTYPSDPSRAQTILAGIAAHVGSGTHVRAPIAIDYGAHLSIGDDTFINFGLTALDVAMIVIGNRCQIGPNCQLLTPVHPLDPALRATGIEAADPITVGDDVWLGGGVIVCPGVTIGSGSVIGAGAVVTRDIPPYSVAVGNPARVVGTSPGHPAGGN